VLDSAAQDPGAVMSIKEDVNEEGIVSNSEH